MRKGFLASLSTLLASAGLAIGFTLLWVIDHYVYPVCPTCSHTHDHGSCSESLHGFAAPLLIASGLHSFFDGWSLAVSQLKGPLTREALQDVLDKKKSERRAILQ